MNNDNCKIVREKILNDVKKEIEELGVTPTLAVINCSDDEASKIYIRNKSNSCNSVGIKTEFIKLEPQETNLNKLINVILDCNAKYNGVMLQLPLDEKFKGKENMLLNLIDSNCDIDGLGNKQKLKLINNEKDTLIPATALAVFKIMEHELCRTDFSGKKVCIINRSDLIGKPLYHLLLNHNASPMICHSKTEEDINNLFLFEEKIFDVVVTGIGKHIIEEFYIENALIIDAGISRDENNKILRDVIRYEYNDNIYYGAVGTVTCACVAYNTLKAYKIQNGIN